jgi:hypothetical protein
MAKIKLHHSAYEGLQFGPEGEIQFGIRGGFEPGYCVIDDDNPLLPDLFAAEGPFLEVVNTSPVPKVYVSPIDPDREFKSKPALMAHIRAAAKAGDPTAEAWMTRYGSKAEFDADEATAAEG